MHMARTGDNGSRLYRITLCAGAVLLLAVCVYNLARLWLDSRPYLVHYTNTCTLAGLFAIAAGVMGYWTYRTTGTLAGDLRHAMRHHPHRFAVLCAIALLALIAGACEVTFAILLHRGAPTIVRTATPSPQEVADEARGYQPLPSATSHVVKTMNGKPVYDVVYTTDAAHRRITPSSADRPGETIVLFFGCSHTFGVGVNDNETLPHYFGLHTPGLAVYNYSVGGQGPSHTLALIESGRLDELVRDRDVIAIYTFIAPQYVRVVGGLKFVTRWGANSPCYELDDDDKPVRRGSFASHRPVRTWLWGLIAATNTAAYYNLDWPRPGTPEQRHLVARILETSAEQLTARARSCRFYLFLPPVRLRAQPPGPLDGSLVTIVDARDLFDSTTDPYRIWGDGHPTAVANQLLAETLAGHILDADAVPAVLGHNDASP